MELKKPKELLSETVVKKRFKNAQQIGNFVAIFGNKFFNKRVYTTVLIDKKGFLQFLKHIEKYK